MANPQFDFALDQDDPSTARQAAFMVNPPFSKNLVIKNLTTQKSFLITDVRLRSLPRKDEDTIYGLDQWAVDIYHKLAGYESQPGVNTRVVDEMGHDTYDRYDNHSITPDTPTQKTIYKLSAREVDLLVHAGAYDDPASTEARLRKNLVGQTWSMPDRVQVSESRVSIPEQKASVTLGNSSETANRHFVIALVQDVGKKSLIDAHTSGSNMAMVMDTALRQMTPGVVPMADIHNDLQAANNVRSLSKDHQIKSQVLDSELDFDSAPAQNDAELNLDSSQVVQPVPQVDTPSPLIDHEDAASVREDLTLGAAQHAGVDNNTKLTSAKDRNAVQKDQSGIDEFLPNASSDFVPRSTKDTQQWTDSSAFNREQQKESQLFDNSDDQLLANPSLQTVSESKPETNINQENKQQQKRQIVRTTEQSAENTSSQQMTDSHVPAAGAQANISSDTNFDYNDLANAQAPSMDELQKMLNSLKAEGIDQGYQAPDYDQAASESPDAQRRKLKLQQRLQRQENEAKSAAAAEVRRSKARLSNVPKFDDSPDL